eukprot:TRINITY_DN1034_c4_g1_i2.p1 TRINITY_DN1034_c4_g1~~TRINITY_DN1034_c4_g1_i2.p1  ORF type:complete len:818 (-),score=165.39 TRINITY_DN1034_c4_g1_i2:228-2681(-)
MVDTSLLQPTIPDSDSFNSQAIKLYTKAMDRDHDRSQRVSLLTSSIHLAPRFREAYFWRGILNFGDLSQNLSDLKTSLSLTQQQTCNYLVIQSQIEAMTRNPDKSVETLTQALSLARNNSELGEVYYFRSFAYWWIDKDEEAVEDCKKSIEFDYNTKSCYTHLADMYKFMRKEELIEQCYLNSLLPTPRYTELVKYGMYLKKIRRKDDAMKVFDQAISRNPDSPDVYEERSHISPVQSSDCLRALKLDTSYRLVQHRRMYSAFLADNGSQKEAIRILTEGIRNRPKAEWYCLRGQMRIEFCSSYKNPEKLKKKGFMDLRKAVKQNPMDTDLQYWLGKVLSTGNEKDKLESSQRLRNALHLQPSHVRFDKKDVETIQALGLPDFRFYPGDAECLYEHLVSGTTYQYVGTTRRAILLLTNHANENDTVMFKLFKNFWSQLYCWKESVNSNSKVVAFASAALANLWGQSMPKNQKKVMKRVEIADDFLSDFSFVLPSGKIIRVSKIYILEAKHFIPEIDFQKTEYKFGTPFSDEMVNIFVHYLYRKPYTTSSGLAKEFLNLLNVLQSNDVVGSLVNYVTEQFNEQIMPEGTSNELVNNHYNQESEKDDEEEEDMITYQFDSLTKQLSELVDNSLYSDVIFECTSTNHQLNNIDEESIHQTSSPSSSSSSSPSSSFSGNVRVYAHKKILSQSSTYFSRLFSNGLSESSRSVLTQSNASHDVFIEVLKYCYGCEVNFTPENCIEILHVSDLMGIEKLKILSELYIGKLVDEDNCEELSHQASLYNAERLKKLCDSKVEIKKKELVSKWSMLVSVDSTLEEKS